MSHLNHKYILPLLAILSVSSCTVEKTGPDKESGNILKIRTYAPMTKSTVNLGNDMIYAYPFSLEGELADLNGIPITANSVIGTEYTYFMPQTSQDILFSNITDGNGGYSLTAPAGIDTLIKITVPDGSSGSDTDLVIGNLPKEDAGTDSPEIPTVTLKRKAAQISLNFRVKQKGSNDVLIEDLSEYISKVQVNLPSASTFCIPSIDDTTGIYYGEVTNVWSSSTIPASSTLSLIQERFIFPSAPGSIPDITLTVTTTTGNIQTLVSSFGTSIEPNKHYNLTLSLRQRSDGFSFEVDSLIHEDIEVNMDYTDIVIEPSLGMSIGMETTSVGDTTYKDFILGTDTLWVYPFMNDTGGTLAAGYPQPQKAIYNGRYTFSVPKGTQDIMFSNTDLCSTESDYLASVTPYRIDTSGLNLNDLYISINESHSSTAGTPLITGFSGEVTIEDAGKNMEIQLFRKSTGVQFLIEFKTEDGEEAPSPADLVQYFWIGLGNSIYNTYNPIDGSFHNYVSTDETETGPYNAEDLTAVEYEGRTLWQLTPEYIYYFMDYNDSRYARILVLTPDGEMKSTDFNFTTSLNELNTIILTVPASTLE